MDEEVVDQNCAGDGHAETWHTSVDLLSEILQVSIDEVAISDDSCCELLREVNFSQGLNPSF